MSDDAGQDDLSAVPLFPLPNVVLFPRAVLPLHIFEDRYKKMTADALAGDRRIAMALLRPGWEKDYDAAPPIDPVVCVGEILSWEKLADGKYNFLLQGRMRARVVRESRQRPYRVAELSALEEVPVLEIDLEEQRRRLVKMFEQGALRAMPAGRQFREILHGSATTEAIADLLAFNYLEDVGIKQSLLSEPDARLRVHRTIDALEEWVRTLNPGLQGFPVDPGIN